MDKKVIAGVAAASIAGVAAGAAVALAVKKGFDKIFGEMQNDANEQVFTSPDGNNTVKVVFGSSKTAKKMALVSVAAKSENDECILLALARKGDNLLTGEWIDNDNFQLLIGSCASKQCCDVSFGDEKISACYYWKKD